MEFFLLRICAFFLKGEGKKSDQTSQIAYLNWFLILTFKVVNYLDIIVDSSTDTEDIAKDMVSIWKF